MKQTDTLVHSDARTLRLFTSTSRIARRLVAPALLFSALLTLLFVSTTRAATFSLPTKEVRFDWSTGSMLEIKHLIIAPTNITITKWGSSLITGSSTSMTLLDSSGTSSGWLFVSYAGGAFDTAEAWFEVTDGVTADTIHVWARDKYMVPSTGKFKVNVEHPMIVRHGWAPVELQIPIRNEVDFPMGGTTTVSSTRLRDAPVQFSMKARHDTYVVQLTYYPAGISKDSVWVVTTDGATVDSLLVIAIDTNARSPLTATISTGDLDSISINETKCTSLTMTNTSPVSMTVTQLSSGNEISGFTLPFTLAPAEAKSIDICATGIATYGSEGWASIQATFKDADNLLGYAAGSAHYFLRQCIGFPERTVEFEPVLLGGHVTRTTWVTNLSNEEVTMAASFSGMQTVNRPIPTITYASSMFPVTIAAHDSAEMTFTFNSGADTGTFYDNLYLYQGTDCSGNIRFKATVVNDNASPTLALFPSQTGVLPMKTKNTSFTKRFAFFNNLSSTVNVTGVRVVTGDYFSISGISPALTATLATGDTLFVDVDFAAVDNGTFSDELEITTTGAATVQRFRLVGEHSGATARVTPAIFSHVEVSVSPNPASERLAIHVLGVSV